MSYGMYGIEFIRTISREVEIAGFLHNIPHALYDFKWVSSKALNLIDKGPLHPLQTYRKPVLLLYYWKIASCIIGVA
jgi:hypothetical protein